MTDRLTTDPTHPDSLKLNTLLSNHNPQERRTALERIAARRAALLLELAQLDAMQAGHRAMLEAEGVSLV